MITVPVYGKTGERIEEMQVDEAALGGEVRQDLLRLAVAVYEARKRTCTKATKGRSEVEGSTRKLYRQKHTGMARAGAIRVPHRRGGGVTFGLHNLNYSRELPRRARREALLSALLARLIDKEVTVFEQPDLKEPKTKLVADLLRKIDPRPAGAGRLIVTGAENENFLMSARNISGVSVMRVKDLNAYDVLCPYQVLFTREAMEEFVKGLA